MNKTCTKCSETKELSLFYRDKAFKDGHRSQCKSCDNIKTRRNYLKNNKYKDADLKRRYGIDVNQYSQILNNQNNCCAICNKDKSEFSYALCVDHNHRTGKVRGLLCKPCNLIVGNCLENKEILEKSITYLEHYEKN